MSDLRFLNRAAARRHALKVSQERRAALFTRVGEDFLDDVESALISEVRQLAGRWSVSPHEPVAPTEEAESLVTGRLLKRAHEELDRLALRIIQSKTQRHPSCGCTLRT